MPDPECMDDEVLGPSVEELSDGMSESDAALVEKWSDLEEIKTDDDSDEQ
jgi:hypothetical protein